VAARRGCVVSGQKVGAAVVGTSFGCVTHVRALRAAGFDVRALVGRDPDGTAERAKRFEVPHAMTSLREVLALPGLDAVTIATPPHTHAAIAHEVIAAGKHVVCEKPLARDADEARRLLDAAEAAGVVHLLGTEYRWSTTQALTARLIRDGAIGEPRLATFLLAIPVLADPDSEVPSWWSDAAQGGGWLGAMAAHTVDQIRVTLGEFEGVSGGLSLVSEHDWTAEDSYTVHFRLHSGVEGVVQSTVADWGPPVFHTRICGTKGTLWAEGDAVWVSDRSGAREIPVPDDLRTPPPDPAPADLFVTAYDYLFATGIDVGPYARLFETFRDLILGRPVPNDPSPATFADGLAGMAVLDAIRRSAADRAWVTVPAVDPLEVV
jgi:predicted dehydrogenase